MKIIRSMLALLLAVFSPFGNLIFADDEFLIEEVLPNNESDRSIVLDDKENAILNEEKNFEEIQKDSPVKPNDDQQEIILDEEVNVDSNNFDDKENVILNEVKNFNEIIEESLPQSYEEIFLGTPSPFKNVEFAGQDENLQNENIPYLNISEVYWLGNDERIEITNLSGDDFSGEVTLKGVKSADYVIDINVSAYSSIIISDKDNNGFIDTSFISIIGAGLNFKDKEGISVRLLYSGAEVDSFIVDTEVVQKNYVESKGVRPSFQKVYNDRREIVPTSSNDSQNIMGSYANPGSVIVQSGAPRIGEGPQNPSYSDGDSVLILSEVFYDDEDEWIEIFNIGLGDFYGDIELSGNMFGEEKRNQIYQNIQIPAGDFIVIADSDYDFDFSDTTDKDVEIVLNQGNYSEFDIPDDEEIQIFLVVDGQEVDTFFAQQYRVEMRDDYGVSFHKVWTENGPIVTRAVSNDDMNLSEDSRNRANPGVLYTYGEEIIDYGKMHEEEPDEPEQTDFDCSNVEEDLITIDEIFRGGDRYEPFVEFDIHEDLEYEFDGLMLSGNILSVPLEIDLNEEIETYDQEKLQKNTKLILTTKAGELTEAGLITIVLHPDLSFNSFSGELELYGIVGHSRQLLDIVKITTGSHEKSTYHEGFIHSCGDEMDNVMEFSPGFDESALKYFSSTSKRNEKIVEHTKYVGGGGGCSCPSKEDLCGDLTTKNGTGNSISSGSSVLTGESSLTGNLNIPGDVILTGNESEFFSGGEDILGKIKILSINPFTPESITFQSFLPYDVDFKNHNYYLKSSTSTTKKYIDGVLSAQSVDIFSKSFGFVDKGACISLYSGDVVLDSYCYSNEEKKEEKSESSKEEFNPSDYQLSIEYVDYDPEGSDTGKEKITIHSSSSSSLDLSKIKMKVNSTNKKLSGILEPYSSFTLEGTFGFPNSTKDGSDVVIQLIYDDYVFTTYTYNPNEPEISVPEGAVKVYSVIDGDTFRYRKEDGTLQSVRLLGVDAPESNTARYRTTECFGKEAKNYLTNLIKNQYVMLEFDQNSASSDAYGRLLAYVYFDGVLVNEQLISEGYAKEYTYKTNYSHQSDFRKAQEKAQKSEKGLWSASTCGKSISEEPEARGIDYEKIGIKISSIIYDPEGTDAGNEVVELDVDLSQIDSLNILDFTDDFKLTITPRSEYSTGTTKTKSLASFGVFDFSSDSIDSIHHITLRGDLALPNNKATCISINQGNYTFDTYCYNPENSPSSDTGNVSGFIFPNVKIQSILPNPSGKDSDKEEIVLLWTPSENFSESLGYLNLNPYFSLLINGKTKKKLDGQLIPNQQITIKGTFSFPNSASCVSLLYSGVEIDSFCYGKASDGVRFNSNNTSILEIPQDELSIIKKISLVKKGDQLCVSYNKTLFTCKKIPNSTTEKDSKTLSMQNSYIAELQNYIKTNYSLLYYDSDLKDYFDLYSTAKKAIKSGNNSIVRNGREISITDVSSLFNHKYQQNAQEFLVNQIVGLIPENVSSTLLQMEDKYKSKLAESDLNFLSIDK